MKKMIAGALAPFLMVAGLVATSGTATAAPGDYPKSVATDTTASGPSSIMRGTAGVYSVITTAGDSNAPGKLVIKVEKNNGNYSQTKTIFKYDGSASVVTPVLKTKGRYTVKFRYIPRANSVYKGSNTTRQLFVTAS